MRVAIGDLQLRAGKGYDLELIDRLEDELGRSGRSRAEHIGLLRRGTGPGTGRWVDRSVALLWMVLERSPGRLPEFVVDDLGSVGAERLALGLVADRVLEVELDGVWESGLEALRRLGRCAVRPEGRLGELSLRALDIAAVQRHASPAAIGEVLYGFNRAPLSDSWRARLEDERAVRDTLGLGRDRLEGTGWIEAGPVPGWLVFRSVSEAPSSSRASTTPRPAGTATHKVYVSPLGDDVVAAVDAVVRCGNRLGALAFKVAGDAKSLARADKLVIYFSSEDAVREAKELLSTELSGIAAQGVPFSSPLDDSGLLSWGMDPPGFEAVDHAPRSWRDWVTRRLAIALHEEAFDELGDGTEPGLIARSVDAALLRLELDGVDVSSWRPDASIWSRGS